MNSIIEKKCRIVLIPSNNTNSYLFIDNETKELFTRFNISDKYLNKDNYTQQELYIISDDEIKEDDWVYENNLNQKTKIYQIEKRDGQLMFFRFENVPIWLNKNVHNCKKIIATTNSDLTQICIRCNGKGQFDKDGYNQCKRCDGNGYKSLPQPSQQFITKFIEEYNKGQMISDVLVEYECLQSSSIAIIDFSKETPQKVYSTPKNCIESKLKVDKNNTITIKRLKENWNREEVIGLIKDAIITGVNIRDKNLVFNDVRDKWISNNL